MNKKMLPAKMVLFGDTGDTLAEFLGINRSTLSYKMNQTKGGEFVQGEIAKIKARYNLTAEELNDIFFADEVS